MYIYYENTLKLLWTVSVLPRKWEYYNVALIFDFTKVLVGLGNEKNIQFYFYLPVSPQKKWGGEGEHRGHRSWNGMKQNLFIF